MRRNTLHFVLDTLLLLAVLALACTGLLLAFVLPGGSGGAAVWGWTRHDWGDLHLGIACTMLAIAALHVALNWTWVCTVACRLVHGGATVPASYRRHLGGAAVILVLVAIVGGFLWAASASKQAGDDGERRGPRWRQVTTNADAPL